LSGGVVGGAAPVRYLQQLRAVPFEAFVGALVAPADGQPHCEFFSARFSPTPEMSLLLFYACLCPKRGRLGSSKGYARVVFVVGCVFFCDRHRLRCGGWCWCLLVLLVVVVLMVVIVLVVVLMLVVLVVVMVVVVVLALLMLVPVLGVGVRNGYVQFLFKPPSPHVLHPPMVSLSVSCA